MKIIIKMRGIINTFYSYKEFSYLFLFLFLSFNLHAQVGINTDSSNPDPSAMLDVKSTDKGMLVPRMSATARQNINAPAIGLMVYDSTVDAFYYFNGQGWLELLSNTNTVSEIVDADGDTKIQVEESADEDVIRFDIDGTQRMNLDSTLDVFVPTIISAAQRDALTIRTGINANEAGLAFSNSGTNYTWSIFRQPVTGNTAQAHLVFAGGVSQSNPNFLTERLRISNTGNVGIGIATPDEKLHINGNTKIDGILNINDAFSFPTTDGTIGQVLETDGAGALSWADKDEVQNLIEDADGDTKIQVEESADEDVIRFDVDGMEVASINSSGQMGIGKTALTRLEVDMGQLANERLMIEQNIGTTSFNTNVTGWQSFTADYSGDLSLVSIKHTIITSTNKFVRIYEGEGTGGSLLYESSTENIVSGGWTDFVITGVSLVKGQQYSIWLNDAQAWQFSGSNPYPQGILKNNSSRDARFRVFVKNSDISFQVDDGLLVVGSYKLPVIDGVDGQALVTDGNGNVSWQSAVPAGTIQMWPTSTPPSGWLICNGSTFNAATYPALNTLLGGNTVPDLRRRFPLGAQNTVNQGETPRPLGSTGGEEEVTLTIAQMPAHTHGIQYREGEESGGGNDYSDLGDTGVNDSTQSTGGGQAHNNMPPYYALHFIIKAE